MIDKTFKAIIDDKEIEYIVIKICRYKDNDYLIYRENNNPNSEYLASKYFIKDNKLVLDEVNGNDVWNYLDKELSDCYE